jgi:hypothetical protein
MSQRRTAVVEPGAVSARSRTQIASRSQWGGLWVRRPTPMTWPWSSSTMPRRSAPRVSMSFWIRVEVARRCPPVRVVSSQPGVWVASHRASAVVTT